MIPISYECWNFKICFEFEVKSIETTINIVNASINVKLIVQLNNFPIFLQIFILLLKRKLYFKEKNFKPKRKELRLYNKFKIEHSNSTKWYKLLSYVNESLCMCPNMTAIDTEHVHWRSHLFVIYSNSSTVFRCLFFYLQNNYQNISEKWMKHWI